MADELGGLPCERKGECAGLAQWEGVPRNVDGEVEYDIIHATANFAHVPRLVENANIIFDEFPEFRIPIDQDTIRRVATGLLKHHSEGGYRWEGLLEGVQNQDNEILAEYLTIMAEAPYQWWRDLGQRVHPLAPLIVEAIASAQPVGSGVFVGRKGRLTAVLDDENTLVTVNHPPDLSEARCVIGLDAHPSPLRWQLSTRLTFEEKRILTDEEDRWWRQNERGLEVIQVGKYTRSYTRGWRGKAESEAEALIVALSRKHGDEFRSCLCPKRIKPDVYEIMVAAGIEEPRIMHYGEERSRNDFAGESVGLVLGCIDPGDDAIVGMLGQLGLRAEPEYYESEDSEKGKRAHGRGFTGPDVDAASELLESVRADSVAQAVGRYARDVEDDDSGSMVYVWTDIVPDDLVDYHVRGVVGRVSEGKEAVEQSLRQYGRPITKREVAEQAGISGKHALAVLNELTRQGVADVSEGTGKCGANEYIYLGGTQREPVDLTFERD